MDGTAIEFDSARFGKHGATLQRQSGSGSQSSGGGGSGGQSGGQSGDQSGSKQSSGDEKEVVLTFDEDVPPEERAELEEQLAETDAERRTREEKSSKQQSSKSNQQSEQGSNQQSQQGSKQQSGGSGKPETLGFVPYDRLLYVTPADETHDVDPRGDRLT